MGGAFVRVDLDPNVTRFGEDEAVRMAALDRGTWREGMVTVYDYEGRYVGCMGRESWDWLLEVVNERSFRATNRVDELMTLLERLGAHPQGACWCGEVHGGVS